MKEFIFLFFGGNASEDMPQEQREQHQEAWDNWMDMLEDEGVLIDGLPIEDEIVTVGGNGQVDRDTPENMDKEVTGYLILETESMEKAIELSKNCPIFEYSGRVQIRQLMSTDLEGDIYEDEEDD